MSENIDWQNATEYENEPSQSMNLGDTELNTPHEVKFLTVKGVSDGMIVATVKSETLEGDTLWLKGKFGPQNGLLSLLKAATEGDLIEGNSFTYERVPSEKSPAGYAHKWTS